MPRKSRKAAPRSPQNQRRTAASISQLFSDANRRAHEQANRRGSSRDRKKIRAIMEADAAEEYFAEDGWRRRMSRWGIATLLLPLCWITMWTLLSRFSQATVDREFWKTPEFWYFAIGALVMVGWLLSGLLQTLFLYLYVLGHELTHAVFVLLHLGKVTDFKVTAQGGYITTNKSNFIIALSPYFVPFWSVVAAVLYGMVRFYVELSPQWDRVLYGLLGMTWTFHLVWTLWMIPRDQPDLRENGTFLSLVIIYLANLLVMVGLLCFAGGSPGEDIRGFAEEWFRHGVVVMDAMVRAVDQFRVAAGF